LLCYDDDDYDYDYDDDDIDDDDDKDVDEAFENMCTLPDLHKKEFCHL
jgi:hypothetical protein